MARTARIGRYNFPLDLYYSDQHVWVKIEVGGLVTMGFDDALAKGTHKIRAIELVCEEGELLRGGELAIVESSKSVEEYTSPITGLITAVNQRLSQIGPSLVVSHAYDEGWLVRVRPSDLQSELSELMYGESAIPFLQDVIATQSLEDADRQAAETVTIDEA